ncbi:hypothetical protein [Sandaracinus amylolyticus]|uniref:Uncharacterized protein n=1 Tax=Sandaracinus amylolyticus TaxID=927083 RepID=A0A0F6SE99_9BACT|nr:hypothetical protein [Sandaracinus amylolyticus]AKF04824.1 hypothetical protein DB32_001973 [Sandaracinus amylolyticus]
MLRFTLVLVALVASGCTTHVVRQSTLFTPPSAGLPQTSHGRADVMLGGSGTTFIETHSRPASEDGGAWLTRGQLDGQVAVRINRFVSVRAAGFLGIPEGAIASDPTTLERPGRVAWGAGPIATFGYASEDEPFFTRAELGVLVGFFPSVLLVTSIEPCPCTTAREEHESFMPIVHGGLAAGYWATDFLAVSAGLVLRNQPSTSFDVEFGVVDEGHAAIRFGELAAIPWMAVELEIEHAVGIVVQAQLPILGEIAFGPTLSLGVRALIGDGPTTTPRARETDRERRDQVPVESDI